MLYQLIKCHEEANSLIYDSEIRFHNSNLFTFFNEIFSTASVWHFSSGMDFYPLFIYLAFKIVSSATISVKAHKKSTETLTWILE